MRFTPLAREYFSGDLSGRHRLVGALLLQVQAIQKPHQLPVGNRLCEGVRRARPLEPAALKAAIVEPEPVAIPAQELKLVSLLIAEDEPTFGERVEIERELNQGGQAIDRFAHVGRAARKMDIPDGSFG